MPKITSMVEGGDVVIDDGCRGLFRNLFLPVQVLGCWPYNSETGRYQLKWLVTSISFAIGQLLCFILFIYKFIKTMLQSKDMDENEREKMLGQSFILMVAVSLMLLSSSIVWQNLLHGKSPRRLMQKWEKVLNNFYNRKEAQVHVSKVSKRGAFLTVFIQVSYIVVTALLMTLNVRVRDEKFGYTNSTIMNRTDSFTIIDIVLPGQSRIVQICISAVISIIITTYPVPKAVIITQLSTIVYAYRNINNNIKDVVEVNHNANISKSRETYNGSKIALLRKQFLNHSDVGSVLDECCTIFGKQVFFILAMYMLSALVGLYATIAANINVADASLLSIMSLIIIYNNVSIIYICNLGSNITEEACKTQPLLNAYLHTETAMDQERPVILTFLQALTAPTPAFRAGDVLTINRSVIITAYSIMTTYAIVLLQMT